MANPKNRREIQSMAGSGYYGDTFEAMIKRALGQAELVSRGRSVDLLHDRKRFEIKTGAGELGKAGTKTCANVSMIIYCPVFIEGASLEKQEAFILDRDTFVEILHEVGLYRAKKVTTNGHDVQAIQTFWNRKQNKPHGKKYYALLDALYEKMTMTLEEFLEDVRANMEEE